MCQMSVEEKASLRTLISLHSLDILTASGLERFTQEKREKHTWSFLEFNITNLED
jgi:hypothetical protein